jgi:hypothetical protein
MSENGFESSTRELDSDLNVATYNDPTFLRNIMCDPSEKYIDRFIVLTKTKIQD